MNDDIEQRLPQLTPCGVSAELRQQVLDAVARELTSASASRSDRRCGLAAAAALLLGIVLNIWVARSADYRLARLYGPAPVPRSIAEIAEAVQSVSDARTSRWVQQHLLAARASRYVPAPQSICSFQQIANDLEMIGKGWHYEEGRESPEADRKNPEMDRDRRRRRDRDTSDFQRHLGLDYQFTA